MSFDRRARHQLRYRLRMVRAEPACGEWRAPVVISGRLPGTQYSFSGPRRPARTCRQLAGVLRQPSGGTPQKSYGGGAALLGEAGAVGGHIGLEKPAAKRHSRVHRVIPCVPGATIPRTKQTHARPLARTRATAHRAADAGVSWRTARRNKAGKDVRPAVELASRTTTRQNGSGDPEQL